MQTVLFAAPARLWAKYQAPLAEAFRQAGLRVQMADATTPPETVDYIIFAPGGLLADFTPYRRTRAVLSLWAGVERIVTNPSLTQPLARMVDPALCEGMVEWVTGHVLRHHLGIDAHILGQDGIWRGTHTPPLARERNVAILGLGELGSAAAEALASLNFRVTGWSRAPRELPGIRCLSGAEGLAETLTRAEILVTLLPDTPETENLLNAATLARLPRGAVIINPGRGKLIDDAALLAALDAGQIAHATLDVFRTEPLPPDHPFWAHPGVTVTPHIAAETRPASAARVVAENIRRDLCGLPLLHLVDRARGY
ncbi:MAG: glyoxylate/hydroxypyruvate reductase A [Phaeovulum sp.]|uniref:2-hydroxyacid dehydrogenase n=1 Tax=Phaeovulum sp. TaxID=2934796 RepID=UPI0027344A0A|nr:glyoxylate/hydroxypyruvate reductase A [Phaeovulum sp.]MDP3861261.1 glyoxylate/hydroxypyruvate reductase A [Phaeovulum sp.]